MKKNKWTQQVEQYKSRPSLLIDWRLLCIPNTVAIDTKVAIFMQENLKALRFVALHHVAEYSVLKGLLGRNSLPIVDKESYFRISDIQLLAAAGLPNLTYVSSESLNLYDVNNSRPEEPIYYVADSSDHMLQMFEEFMSVKSTTDLPES